jgi:hypothetical protein
MINEIKTIEKILPNNSTILLNYSLFLSIKKEGYSYNVGYHDIVFCKDCYKIIDNTDIKFSQDNHIFICNISFNNFIINKDKIDNLCEHIKNFHNITVKFNECINISKVVIPYDLNDDKINALINYNKYIHTCNSDNNKCELCLIEEFDRNTLGTADYLL